MEEWRGSNYCCNVCIRLGINKTNIRFAIGNGLPPSISAWAQEFRRTGRDGKQSYAYILFSDNDIQHVGFWA